MCWWMINGMECEWRVNQAECSKVPVRGEDNLGDKIEEKGIVGYQLFVELLGREWEES